MTRHHHVIAALVLCSLATVNVAHAAFSGFVKVNPANPFRFMDSSTGKPFVPLGTNFTPTDIYGGPPDYFNPCLFDTSLLGLDLAAMKDLGVNTLKINLDVSRLLNPNSTADSVQFNYQALFEFEQFMDLAEGYGIRLVVVVPRPGWFAVPPWWFPNGDMYGEKNLKMYDALWRQLASRYKDRKVIMAWNFAIELTLQPYMWYETTDSQGNVAMPLWRKWLRSKYRTIDSLRVEWCGSYSPCGLVPASVTSFDQITPPYCPHNGNQFPCNRNVWFDPNPGFDGFNRSAFIDPITKALKSFRAEPEEDPKNECSSLGNLTTNPEYPKIRDLQLFREWIALRWIKNQTDAIRAVDSNHLISVGLPISYLSRFAELTSKYHASQPLSKQPLSNGGIRDNDPFEPWLLMDEVDFTEIHTYPGWPCRVLSPGVYSEENDAGSPLTCTGGQSGFPDNDQIENIRHVLHSCFDASRPKPVIMGEFSDMWTGLNNKTESQIADVDEQIVRLTAKDVSGWLCWFWQHHLNGGTAFLNTGLIRNDRTATKAGTPSEWGVRFQTKLVPDLNNTSSQLYKDATGPRGTPNFTMYLQRDWLSTSKDYRSVTGGGIDDPATALLPKYTLNTRADFTISPNLTGEGLELFDAKLLSHNLPRFLEFGKDYPAHVRVMNTGTVTWPGNYPYRFTLYAHSSNPNNSDPLGVGLIPAPMDMAQGQEADFDFVLHVPPCTTLCPAQTDYTFTLQMRDNAFSQTDPSYAFGWSIPVTITAFPGLAPGDNIVTGAGPGAPSPTRVEVYHFKTDGTRVVTASFDAFPNATAGGANVAVGDLDGDGNQEILVAQTQVRGFGPQLDPEVRIFSMAGTLVASFTPSPAAGALGGFYVAAGNVDGLPGDETIVSYGPWTNNPPRVQVFTGLPPAPLGEFTAFNDERRYGATVAAGDVDADGVAEIIVGEGPDDRTYPYLPPVTPARVEIWKLDPTCLPSGFCKVLSFKPFPPLIPLFWSTYFDESHGLGTTGFLQASASCPAQMNIPYGVTVGSGDLVPEPAGLPQKDEIIVGHGPYPFFNASVVAAFQYVNPTTAPVQVGATFTTVEGGVGLGVNVAGADVDGDGREEVLAAAAASAVSPDTVRPFNINGAVLPRYVRPRTSDVGGASVAAGRARRIVGPILPPIEPMPRICDFIRSASIQDFLQPGPIHKQICLDSGVSVQLAILAGNYVGALSALTTFQSDIASDVTDPGTRDQILADALVLQSVLTAVANNHPPVANAGPDQQVLLQTGPLARVTLDATGSSDPDSTPVTNDGIFLYQWQLDGAPVGSGPVLTLELPLGTHQAVLTVIDTQGASAQDDARIDVVDRTPPVLTVSASPRTLWPPNHEMVEIQLDVQAGDMGDPAPVVTGPAVVSSEPDDAPGEGDGHTTGDIVMTADGRVFVRAERDGTGPGRRYTITFAATDASGNQTTTSTDILVPHSQGGQ